MLNYYIYYFVSTFLLAAILTFVTIKIATKLKILDYPEKDRKIHKKSTPLLGGFAIFLSFFAILFLIKEKLLAGNLNYHHWVGFFVGAVFLMIGGYLDDKYNLNPKKQIIWPILAIFSVIAGGVGIEKISNPFDGILYLNQLKLTLWHIQGKAYYLIILTDLFTFVWLIGMMYTTKLLDGVDGLVSGMAAIGGLIIFLFTVTTQYYQPDIALASLVFSAACLGFLVFNWHPAKIFLGEGGSLLLGYILGVLAIISGGKVAIALLIMGIPVLDVAWTIIRRILKGKNPFRFADKKHLHHRLLDIGLTQRKTVLIFYLMAITFGASGLFLQSQGKLLALFMLFVIMIILVTLLRRVDKGKIYASDK